MIHLIRFFSREHLISNIITFIILSLGVFSLFKIQRDIWPRVDFKTTLVNVFLPGASPQQIEKLVLNPVEEALKEVDGIKRVLGSAIQNRALLTIELDENARNPRDTNEDIQNAIDRISNLPEEAQKPIVTKMESGRYPVIELKLMNPQNTIDVHFRDTAKHIADDFSFVPLVSKVSTFGIEDKEYVVEADSEKLKLYHVSLNEIITTIANYSVSIPSGKYKTHGDKEVLIRTESQISSTEDIENLYIRSNVSGYGVQIKDVARVKFDLSEPEFLYRFNKRPTISLEIIKKLNADALKLVEKVKERVKVLNEKYAGVIEITSSNDFSNYLKNRLKSLSSNLFLGLFLVLIILSIFLPLPVTLTVTIGIPTVMLATIFVFDISGQSLNMISMIGLIIVTGMVVDDAIVVCENIWRNLEEGKPLALSAREGAIEVLTPVTASILTTVLFFAPMLTMSGVFGAFVYHIPSTVILALSFSWLEAFFLMPSHFESWVGPFITSYIRKTKDPQKKTHKIKSLYLKFTHWSLRFRYIMLAGCICFIFGISAALALFGRFILFPPEGIESFFIKIEAPVETPLKEMIKHVKPIEQVALNIEKSELKDVYTEIGIIQQDPFDPQTRRGSNYAYVRVALTPQNTRNREAHEIIDSIRPLVDQAKTKELTIGYDLQRQGPPQGRDISIDIRGKDFKALDKITQKIQTLIQGYKGTFDIQNSYIIGKNEWFVQPDSQALQAYGTNSILVSQALRSSFEGVVASKIKDFDEEIDIRVKTQQSYKGIIEALSDVSVSNLQGQLIRLGEIAKFDQRSTILSINHLNYKRVINIAASVNLEKNTSSNIMASLKPQIKDLLKQYEGYESSFGGEDRDTSESLQSFKEAFFMAIVLIYLLLIITFRSLIQPALIMVSIPFGFVGSAMALTLHGRPFSFMGILGIIALGGVIVNNAIVLIDFINEKRKQGLGLNDSIIQSCSERFRPILLTTATTVFGLLPTAYGEQIYQIFGIGGGDPFLVPIAITLGWGLAFGSLMTLIFFPAITRIVDDLSQGLSKLMFFKKVKPKKESLFLQTGLQRVDRNFSSFSFY